MESLLITVSQETVTPILYCNGLSVHLWDVSVKKKLQHFCPELGQQSCMVSDKRHCIIPQIYNTKREAGEES